MLRNSFLNRYKVKISKEMEFEENLKKQDDNYNLYENRPIGDKEIKRLPNKQLNLFVEDLMINRKTSSILYSTNAVKEIRRYIHSNEVMANNFLTGRGSSQLSLDSNGEFKLDPKKTREYRSSFNKIKEHISKFKLHKQSKCNILNKKINIFYKEIKKQNSSKDNSSSEALNSLRITNYNRSLQQCRSLFETKPNFKLPNVGLQLNDVFSRLFHNAVQLNQANTEFVYKDSNSTQNNNKKKDKKKLFTSQSFTSLDTYSLFNRKMFNVKNVIKSSNGREFTMKITDNILNKCLFKHSGGPLSSYELNYNKTKLEGDRCNSVTLLDHEKQLVSLSNMKDKSGNSYLHDAVLDDSIEFVKYYLGKKLSPNEQNAKGNTPLHYAMKENNIKIIRLLLDNKGDFNTQNNYRETPYELASNEAKKLCR